MHDFLTSAWHWVQGRWPGILLDVGLVIAILIAIENITKQPRDGSGKVITDLVRRRKRLLGWWGFLLAVGLIGVLYWANNPLNFGAESVQTVAQQTKQAVQPAAGQVMTKVKDTIKAFPWTGIIVSIIWLGVHAVLFMLSNSKKQPSVKEFYLRLSGTVLWSLGWTLLFIFGFKLWLPVILLVAVSVTLLHPFSIPLLKRGVASLFDQRYYNRPGWLLGEKYLDTGLHFSLLSWLIPWFYIILVPRQKVFYKGRTTELPTKAYPDQQTGADCTWEYECDFFTGEDPEAAILLGDTSVEKQQAGIDLKVGGFLKKHSLSYTIGDHLNGDVNTAIDPDNLNGMVAEIESFIGSKILRLRILDPTPSKEWRDQAQKTAAAEAKRREVQLGGRGLGDAATAEVNSVACWLAGLDPDTPSKDIPEQYKQQARDYILGTKAVTNPRNVFVAPNALDVIRSIAGR